MNIQASYRTFICLVEGASLCVLAIRPGVSGWMRRTLHQLVYCSVGPVPLDSLICQFGPGECLKSSGTSLPCGFRTSPAGDSGGKIA